VKAAHLGWVLQEILEPQQASHEANELLTHGGLGRNGLHCAGSVFGGALRGNTRAVIFYT
jgi:hypothetical protein